MEATLIALEQCARQREEIESLQEQLTEERGRLDHLSKSCYPSQGYNIDDVMVIIDSDLMHPDEYDTRYITEEDAGVALRRAIDMDMAGGG